MSTDKRTQEKPYICICGTVIAHKRKSLKKHLLTKAHIQSMPCPPHHWIIESANGHLSHGYCQNCNEKKMFENSIGQYSWTSGSQRESKEKNEVEELATSEA